MSRVKCVLDSVEQLDHLELLARALLQAHGAERALELTHVEEAVLIVVESLEDLRRRHRRHWFSSKVVDKSCQKSNRDGPLADDSQKLCHDSFRFMS